MKVSNRLQRLRQGLAEKDIDAILISQPENMYYLSGFNGSSGYLLITPQNMILATDFRYLEQAKRHAHDCEIFQISGNIAGWFLGLVAELDLRRLGFEARHITSALYQQLADTLNRAGTKIWLVPTDGLVECLRAIKEPEEIELITKASAISDRAMEYIEGIIHAGMSEQEAAWEIEKFLREQGSAPLPFDIIVAVGSNSALPHAEPSPRKIHLREPVIIDIGARIGGYSSDLSRTICLGTPSDTFNKVYDTVLEAQRTALAIIREGMSCHQADSVARTVIKQAGYGEAFGHGLGHGLGLAAHESPRLGPHSPEHLVGGMVFTIEPGIYLTGWGGIRIEDLVIIENGKLRAITKAKK